MESSLLNPGPSLPMPPFGRMLMAAIIRGDRHWGQLSNDSPREILAAQSLAGVGMLALVGLPFLMLASLALRAPLAGPAVIAIGFLLIARVQAAHGQRQASVAAAIVLTALVVWAAALAIFMAKPMTWSGWAAVALAPAFAAAPAAMQGWVRRKLDSDSVRIAPPVPARSPYPEYPDAELQRQIIAGADAISAPFTAAEPHAPRACACGRRAARGSEGDPAPAGPAVPSCDLREAALFARERLSAAARSKRVGLSDEGGAMLGAGCDRRSARRIATTLLDAALAASASGGKVTISTRPAKGSALLRITGSDQPDGVAALKRLDAALAAAELGALVEACGGTLVTDGSGDTFMATVRLALTPAAADGGQAVRAA